MSPAGIKPATFRFVAQRLNHCVTAVPGYLVVTYIFVHAIAQAFSSRTLTTEVRVLFQTAKLEQYSKDHDFQQ